MQLQSFRIRIALLSVALAGSALIGFAFVAWRLIYVAKIGSLDAKLREQLQQMTVVRSPEWFQSFSQELPGEIVTQIGTPIILLATDSIGNTRHYSVRGAQLGGEPLETNELMKTIGDQLSNDIAEAVAVGTATFRRSSAKTVLTRNTATGSWRIGIVHSEAGRGVIAVSLQTIDRDMAIIRNIFLVVIPATTLMIAVGAWILSGSALKPVEKLTGAIKQVTATGLDQQVPIGSSDVEFVELIEVFNQMLARLARSFKQSSRFSGDAAHELKTPLAILRGELERVMQQAEPGSDLQQSLSQLMDEVSRLSTIVRKLLLLSLADAGQMSLRQKPVDIGEILTLLLEDVEMLAPDLLVKVDLTTKLNVQGDRDLLTQVLQNLIDNAIKYNLPEGSTNRWLSIEGKEEGMMIAITMTNSSIGIPNEDRDHIFDRFYRGDLSRNRKREGFGLGLSLSREIARAHKGELKLENTQPGVVAFTLVLPIQS
ncbi:ATPase, histidine kinase-, DNA gyrase B-, and HSP90-like domain protein [Synechococcus sp. PCC 7335]|uniref:sensor histidine kinase n=1 Tax=Synechococcus sp. (strain ATCC 29403 / PCC 7335) TaxID=91464 RepID=UPI00017EC767|nr:ATP-binding protein [Synechococcus sp. PCC 7335]EDX86349.1 ATPase, histidine kinase-, DNA gyrase B-, and HSP90-like domain protein [Synechococcus sp. PCC 7335]